MTSITRQHLDRQNTNYSIFHGKTIQVFFISVSFVVFILLLHLSGEELANKSKAKHVLSI
jgi:hypothetical protein